MARKKKIPTLSDDQKALLQQVADKWSRITLSTERVDRAAAEQAARDMYVANKMPEPSWIAWVDSPLAGAVLATLISRQARHSRYVEHRNDADLARARATLGEQAWADAVYYVPQAEKTVSVIEYDGWPVSGRVADEVGNAVQGIGARVLRACWAIREHRAVPTPVYALRGWCVWERAALYAKCEFLERIHPAGGPSAHARRLAENAFWWWTFDTGLILCDRPSIASIDDQSSLHSEDGPALAWRDGWTIHAVRGVIVPREVVESPESITPGMIESERNAEVRRLMLDRYGAEKFIQDSGSRLVHEDECGALYKRPIARGETLAMVRVRNATPEPDGTFKEYWLRVPPSMKTARGAVAWTFGMTASEYVPAKES